MFAKTIWTKHWIKDSIKHWTITKPTNRHGIWFNQRYLHPFYKRKPLIVSNWHFVIAMTKLFHEIILITTLLIEYLLHALTLALTHSNESWFDIAFRWNAAVSTVPMTLLQRFWMAAISRNPVVGHCRRTKNVPKKMQRKKAAKRHCSTIWALNQRFWLVSLLPLDWFKYDQKKYN